MEIRRPYTRSNNCHGRPNEQMHTFECPALIELKKGASRRHLDLGEKPLASHRSALLAQEMFCPS